LNSAALESLGFRRGCHAERIGNIDEFESSLCGFQRREAVNEVLRHFRKCYSPFHVVQGRRFLLVAPT
jgi:hypothetical protein